MKYKIKEATDVFPFEFLQFIEEFVNRSTGLLIGEEQKDDDQYNHRVSKVTAKEVFLKIESYEKREGLEFVCFFGNSYIIFKEPNIN